MFWVLETGSILTAVNWDMVVGDETKIIRSFHGAKYSSTISVYNEHGIGRSIVFGLVLPTDRISNTIHAPSKWG